MATYQVEKRRRWGPVWSTSLLFKPAVVVTGSNALREAFREEARKETSAFFPPHHQRLFGPNSILTSSGKKHDIIRNMVSQALTPKALSGYTPFIEKAIEDFVATCKSKGTFSMAEELREFLVLVSLRVLLGRPSSNQEVKEWLQDVNLW
eukprot:CAMPEP_0167787258 /NCGR_PEP_ID=MMETSP0111_2-20121227/9302_1 /TAXON_ID=91324 /ORGANISM="Lotharella globosa, Strain CCCM811" /LENGTH=149 /DNA_ID=CAMNT_0007678839 /DNA_START=378 /DNA_END=824 /DNA_ORIENTATION=+